MLKLRGRRTKYVMEEKCRMRAPRKGRDPIPRAISLLGPTNHNNPRATGSLRNQILSQKAQRSKIKAEARVLSRRRESPLLKTRRLQVQKAHQMKVLTKIRSITPTRKWVKSSSDTRSIGRGKRASRPSLNQSQSLRIVVQQRAPKAQSLKGRPNKNKWSQMTLMQAQLNPDIRRMKTAQIRLRKCLKSAQLSAKTPS